MFVAIRSMFDHQRSGAIFRAGIISGLNQFHAQRDRQQPDQVGQQHDTADQHAHDRQGFALVMFLNLTGQAANSFTQLFFGKKGFHAGFLSACFAGTFYRIDGDVPIRRWYNVATGVRPTSVHGAEPAK